MSITLITKITVQTIDKKPETLMDKVMRLEEEIVEYVRPIKKEILKFEDVRI
jgi:hypothetical protein